MDNELQEHQPRLFPRGIRNAMNPVAFSIMIKALQTTLNGHTYQELCAMTGLSESTVRTYCKVLVSKEAAHICGWDPDSMGRDNNPRYKLGMGINVPRRLKGPNHKRDLRRARDRAARVAQQANQSL
jgi:hypothetical protein